MRFETIAAQAAHGVDPATGAVAPPIYLSTTFERDPDGEFSRGFVYSRVNNPNRQALEECLSLLEGGATAAALFPRVRRPPAPCSSPWVPGDHVIAPRDCYHGTALLLREVFAPWGLDTTFVDMTDPSEGREGRPSQHPAGLGGDPVQPTASDY